MLEQIIQEIKDKGWAHQSEFLSREDLERISQYFNAQRENFVPAKVGKDKQRVESIRGDFTLWVDPLSAPEEFKKIFKFLNELQRELNQNLYLGLREYECHLAYYPVGTFYQKHLDRFSKDSSRAFSFIFYLNEQWNDEDGGELILFDKKGEMLQKISPRPGSLICFLSDEFPHEVKPASRERRSFTGWMHTKNIY